MQTNKKDLMKNSNVNILNINLVTHGVHTNANNVILYSFFFYFGTNLILN